MKKIKFPLITFFIFVIAVFIWWSNTTHWTVYTNSEYGFSVALPTTFSIKPDLCCANSRDYFNFSIVNPKGVEYLTIDAYKKLDDYEEPSGPFPEEIVSERGAVTVIPYVFNAIQGFKREGETEGGGGSFDFFEFVHNGKVWHIEFSVEEGNFPAKIYNQEIYSKIKDSFILIK